MLALSEKHGAHFLQLFLLGLQKQGFYVFEQLLGEDSHFFVVAEKVGQRVKDLLSQKLIPQLFELGRQRELGGCVVRGESLGNLDLLELFELLLKFA